MSKTQLSYCESAPVKKPFCFDFYVRFSNITVEFVHTEKVKDKQKCLCGNGCEASNNNVMIHYQVMRNCCQTIKRLKNACQLNYVVCIDCQLCL